jgi:carboxylesterase
MNQVMIAASHPHPAPTGPRSGQAVLLLHGLCANPLEMQPLARVLEKDGYVVRNPLIAGLGLDAEALRHGFKPGRCEQWLEEADLHLQALRQRHDQVAVAGLCIGAVLALALAGRAQVDALLLISPTLYFDGWNVSPWRRLLPLAYVPLLRHRMSFAERPPYGVKNERLRRWLQQAMGSQGLSAAGAASLPAASLYEAERLIRRVKPLLPTLKQPTLVQHAVEDDVASPRSAQLLAERLGRAPEIEWYHDSYHMLTLDNEREAVCARARRFIHEQLPRRSASLPDTLNSRQLEVCP